MFKRIVHKLMSSEGEGKMSPSNSTVEQLTEELIKLKETSISKALYEDEVNKLKNENGTLVKALVKDRPINQEQAQSRMPRAKEISSIIKSQSTNKTLSDLELVKLTLEQREIVLNEKGVDMFVGNPHSDKSGKSIDEDTGLEVAQALTKLVQTAEANKMTLSESYKFLKRNGQNDF